MNPRFRLGHDADTKAGHSWARDKVFVNEPPRSRDGSYYPVLEFAGHVTMEEKERMVRWLNEGAEREAEVACSDCGAPTVDDCKCPEPGSDPDGSHRHWSER